MPELEKELRNGYANFNAYGVLKVTPKTWGTETISEKSGYKWRRANITLELGQGKFAYIELMGGYNPSRPVLYRLSKTAGEGMLTIPYDRRYNEKIVDNVANASTFKVGDLDENKQIIVKTFLSELDAINEMEDTFKDGDKVHIWGRVEYSEYDGKVQRRFNLRGITPIHTDSERINKFGMELTQTYLFNQDSFSSNYEEELEENGSTTFSVHVPQYIGKRNDEEVKKVLPFPQNIVFKANHNEKRSIAQKIKVIEKLLKPDDEDIVKEISLYIDCIDGYESSTGELEITPELQEFIDLGLTTESKLKEEATVNGNRIQENVIKGIVTRDNKPQIFDKYDISVLQTAVVEDEEEVVSSDEVFGDFEEDSLSSEVDKLFK